MPTMTMQIGLTRDEVTVELVKSGRTEDEANALIDQAIAGYPGVPGGMFALTLL